MKLKYFLIFTVFSLYSFNVVGASKKDLNVYYFGHSLVHHTEYKIPTPKDHTSIPHWMASLAKAADYRFTVDGQFGFLRNHAELPPQNGWYFDHASSGWGGSFVSSQYDAAILTPANFIQYQGAHKPYYDEKKVSPLDASLKVLDFVTSKSPKTKFYLYESWPEMGNYAEGYPPKVPSASQQKKYHRYTQGDFHDWWVDYHARMSKARPNVTLKMIPVGQVLSRLLTETELKNVPFAELFEDAAPHGRPTVYFLAALVHYSVLYQEKPPAKYEFDASIHPLVKTHYTQVVNKIWQELNNYKDKKGNSLVW